MCTWMKWRSGCKVKCNRCASSPVLDQDVSMTRMNLIVTKVTIAAHFQHDMAVKSLSLLFHTICGIVGPLAKSQPRPIAMPFEAHMVRFKVEDPDLILGQ